jgi:hypothetical protein
MASQCEQQAVCLLGIKFIPKCSRFSNDAVIKIRYGPANYQLYDLKQFQKLMHRCLIGYCYGITYYRTTGTYGMSVQRNCKVPNPDS